MKQTPKLDWGLCLGAVACLLAIWNHTWDGPGAEPPHYYYQTFRWPSGTETGTYTFFPGMDVPDATKIIGQGCQLGEILEKAQLLGGYEMSGTAGDTIILCHPDPADSHDSNARARTFEVAPDPLR